MNILCIEQFSSSGGGQRSLIDLLPAFSAHGWKPRVAVPGEGPFPEAVRKLGFHTDHLQCGSYSSIRKSPREMLSYACRFSQLAASIRELVRSHRVDLLYVNGARYLPPAAWVSRLARIPVLFHCHSRLVQPSAVLLAGESSRLSRAHVIACCQYVAQPLRRYVRRERLSVLYNGVDFVKTNANGQGALRRIGVLGRIEPEKGQMEFVEAGKLLLREFPNCQFSVIGSPMFSSPEYRDRVVAASRGLPIQFVGWQNDIALTFSNLDLLVVPSTRFEATTRVILEAYSARLPVVAFPSGGIPEIVRDNETGFLAAAVTPDALAQRIASVLRMSSADLNAVVTKAKLAWQQNYTLDLYQKHICDVVRRAVQ
jgi:glycosyltransferase involved in cell wall biosynthesis